MNNVIDYDKILELNDITYEDCCELYNEKHITTILNDGKVINLMKEGD